MKLDASYWKAVAVLIVVISVMLVILLKASAAQQPPLSQPTIQPAPTASYDPSQDPPEGAPD